MASNDDEILDANFPQQQLAGGLQENILTLLATSDKYCKLVMANVPLELYSNDVMREIATACVNYIHEYGKAPQDHLPDLLEKRLDVESKDRKKAAHADLLMRILTNIHDLAASGFNEGFVVHQLENFVKQQALRRTAVGIVRAAEAGSVDEADKLLDSYRRITFAQFSPGLRMAEYVKSIGEEAFDRPIVELGIPSLDHNYLGLVRKELHLLMAPMKRGKTWWLCHLAKQSLLARQRTVIITLEVSPEIYAQRLLQSFFAMTRREGSQLLLPVLDRDDRGRPRIRLREAKDRLALLSKGGIKRLRKEFGLTKREKKIITLSQAARLCENLVIQGFPTGTLSFKQLEGYIENLGVERFIPDVLLLDYPDLMSINTRDYRLQLGLLMKQLRGLAVERNLALGTVSQSTRKSMDARLITDRDAAEDISKVSIADVILTYNQTKEERKVSVARLFVAGARNSDARYQSYIMQGYPIGQFVLRELGKKQGINPKTYFSALPIPDDDEDEGEDREGDLE